MGNTIYVTVTQSGTMISRIIKLFTRKPYNHASLSSDINLSEMYSFCRTYPRFPIPATFNKEVVGHGTLALCPYIPCEVYEIPISFDQKKQFENLIKHFESNRRSYSYNYLGLWYIFFNIGHRRKNKFVCSQFAAYILHQIGIELNKPVALYSPEDFRHLTDARLIYKGELNTYYYQSNKLSCYNAV